MTLIHVSNFFVSLFFSLRTIEADLKDITQTSNENLDRLCEIAKQTSDIQQQMMRSLENQVMQHVLKAVLASTTDKDFQFNKKDLSKLKTKIHNLPGVEFDEYNFNKFCNTNDIITGQEIMSMFRNLKDPNVPNEDNIFRLHPEYLFPKGSKGAEAAAFLKITSFRSSNGSHHNSNSASPTSVTAADANTTRRDLLKKQDANLHVVPPSNTSSMSGNRRNRLSRSEEEKRYTG